MTDVVVVVAEPQTTVAVLAEQETVVAVASPARGPAGPPGPPGSGGGIGEYVHTQTVPAAVWTVEHDLGRRPAAVTVFSADYSVEWSEFSIQHIDFTILLIAADVPISGVALVT